MTTRRRFAIAGAIVIVFAFVLGGAYFMTADSDGIVEGKVYGLAYTYKTDIKGSTVEGRVFDFADRNLPRTSILVPVRDARGIPLAREVDTMAPSTIRKMRVRVSAVKVEGVLYPAYEYVEWQYPPGPRVSRPARGLLFQKN